MPRVLLAWIGKTDIKAATGDASAGDSPIAQAVAARAFDHVVLLNNYRTEEAALFERWLEKKAKVNVVVRQETLSSPTNHADIYRAVTGAVPWVLAEYGKKAKLTFHLSPGTPAMASIWIIVAKTRFEAELIESSKEAGVRTVDVPFELAAEFVPDAIRRADEDLERLSGGLRPEEPKFGDILHRSDKMKSLVRRARQAAPYSASILIEGESGTGKELLAAAIHMESPRKGQPFVPVNCGAIPKDLVESSLFGHVKGSFTGAFADYAGVFEQANNGTLFLDEVGELPLDAQVKLLRALQEKEVRPIGGKKEVKVDVRVIAATNRNLLEEVRTRRFREDLYFRLAVLVLKVPPLRDREGDVGLLLQKLLDRLNVDMAAQSGGVQKKLSVGAKNLLQRHPWPGNVRELEATLLRAYIWSKGPVIEEAEAREALVGVPGGQTQDVLERPLGDGFSLTDLLGDVARHYLARAMAEAKGNKTKAASLVGLANYQTLKNWLEKYEVAG
ncbi:sigma 54-interacting transcriptional regulator [Polyangium sp. 15x6]|uniref:sigma-54 interaction domain-containing protein n=1 Tax=Polyangium sp. 15x6 TaxID=3042687 RepID=UPI00249AEFD7|nr:sigma 54-interacting transcriptional regulator [Polyangium sp. 15x6]MDI3289757.1 sigma 54-interacting transcriptional regulator [Polyangium sp. 15x6]